VSTQAPISEIIPPQIPAKPLKDKYDRRKRSPKSKAAILGAAHSNKQLGRPNYVSQALTLNSSVKALKQFELIASLACLYQAAWDKKDIALCVQMQEDARNRLFGKPFTAINPAEGKQSATLNQDNRLQVAIGTLIVGKNGKADAKQAKLLAAQQDTIAQEQAKALS
jgi:hypothetical protein